MGRSYKFVREHLARNIRELRGNQSLSQEALALNADVDRTFVSQIERASANPSLLVLCKLAVVLQVDVVDLLAAKGSRSKATSDIPPRNRKQL